MLVALTLLGCTTWIDQEPACGQDVYYWSDDLLAYVLTGDGSGDFDLDPEDAPRTSIEGSYEPATGDFSWTEKYDQGHYLRRAEADGFGTVYHNGNLDLLFTRTVTDMLDETFAMTWRVQRDGCDMTIASWDAENGSVEDAVVREGSYSDASVWEWTHDFPGYSWKGSLRKNLSRTEQIEADDGSYWLFTTEKPDGESTSEFSNVCGDYFCEGDAVTHFDGDWEQSYTAYDGDEVVYTFEGSFDYAGDGSATLDYPGDRTCELVYEGDECSYECDDGDDGDCS